MTVNVRRRKKALLPAVTLALLASLAGVAVAEEIALLNQKGAVVAYVDIEDEATIYLWSGIPTAYLSGTSIYGFNGRHLGWFEDGIVRGRGGRRIGYTEDAIAAYGVPPRVFAGKEPRKPKPPLRPEQPAPPKPVFIDTPSPVPLGELLRRGWP